MEYLLREKLEKLVQSQIEARMVSMRRDGKSFDASVVAALKVCGVWLVRTLGGGGWGWGIGVGDRSGVG